MEKVYKYYKTTTSEHSYKVHNDSAMKIAATK